MNGGPMSDPQSPLPNPASPDREDIECRIGNHRFRIAPIGVENKVEVLRLFADVFGQTPNDCWFDWKYQQGRGKAVGLWNESGHLVAHYAGIPRTLVWLGKPVESVQIGDVMVAPQVRGLMTRKGPFFQVCTRFFDTWVGAEKGYRLAFGFPNQRAMTLGAVLNLYHNAGRIHQLRWPARSKRLAPWWRWSPVAENGARLTHHVADAWTAMARESWDIVLGARDLEYLRWRFLDRPDRQYRLFRLSRWPMGDSTVVVMRFSDGGAELLDVIGSRKTFRAAIQAAIAEATRAGAAELTAWASPTAAALLGGEAQVVDSGASLAVARASVLSADEVATAKWWWMGGDTDFL